jgi:nanoRNase/pAp phosphatase (c-di-AMP/oligoRNAs hydrolase)
MAINSKTLCIYHGNCQDGFGAAWAVHRALGENVEFHPGVYQDAPPDVTGRDVLLVDFSYKRPVLGAMAQTARSILILDHHKSAEEDLAPFKIEVCGSARLSPLDVPSVFRDYAELGRPPILAHFDMTRSGAGMAWDYFYPDTPRPPLIDHIEDRDLWRFKLEDTRVIAAALFSYPYDFALWDSFMFAPGRVEQLAIEGEAIERKHHQDIANTLAVTQREMVIGGVAMPVANLPLTMTSDAGHRMATGHAAKCAACYWDTPEGRVFSLRSTDDGPDVSSIAKLYGGGGHAHAAGFRMPRDWEGDDR